MGIFTYFGNVVTGRIAHWNDTNKQIVTDLWERAEQFPEPAKLIFLKFIGSSMYLVEELLGPHKGRKRLIRKDLRRVSRRQFADLYAILLESHVGMYLHVNRPSLSDLSEYLKGALVILTGRNPDKSRMIQLIDGLDEFDLMQIGTVAWAELVKAAGSSQGTTTIDGIEFIMYFGTSSTQAFIDLKAKLSSIASEP